ncbi:MAG: SDR family NAD(P)-dependent oxidoreductase [Actinomycetota bacterium]|nr:SDR family NAD(P)-dependent oxidoreductase [Actinomycetota bacterium]
MELRGSHVLVTGASRGIGEAMARRFAAAGARVSLAARTLPALAALAGELRGAAFDVDLLDPAAVDGLIARVERDAGPIDVLVNNAGVETKQWLHLDDPQHLRDAIALNLEAPVMLTRAVLPGMLARGRGSLVFTSSLAGTAGFPGLAVYAATKAGINNFVASVRLELRDTPVHLTLVAAGPVDTRMWDALEDQTDFDPMLRRLNLLHLIPKKSPDLLARRTVSAVQHDRRHVRVPRRQSLTYWLGESPRRITELALTKVPFVPPARSAE